MSSPVLQRPKHITSLATSGLLFGVIMHRWAASKQNRKVSGEVAVTKKADPRAVRVVQDILSGDPRHRALVNHRQTVYNWLRRIGFPYCDTKLVYVPTPRIPQAKQEYEALKKQDSDLLEEFLLHYPSIVSDAAFRQGEMFDRSLYPTVEQVRGKFTMELFTSEVPQSDYSVEIASDLAEDLHRNYSRQVERLIDQILSRQAEQLITVMESLSHCCDTEIVTGKDGEQKVKRRKIYDSTVTKALELCNTYREFNLTANPHLESARARLQTLLEDVPLSALRDSDGMRETVKREVDDILSKFRPVAPTCDEDDDE